MNEELKNNIFVLNTKLITNKKYASLLGRCWGGILNLLIIMVISIPISLVSTLLFPNKESIIKYGPTISIYFGVLFSFIYRIYFMSSKKQATLGEYFVGIRFSEVNGKHITIFKALVLTSVLSIVGVIISFFIQKVFENNEIQSKDTYIYEVIITIIIHITPYFLTERKQFLVDWLVGVVALRDDTT
jgi:uncharacterized RDD family membrane protein YckC